MEWKPTHRVSIGNNHSDIRLVMLDGDGSDSGPAYTKSEWDSHSKADIECVDGRWLFQGEPFLGTVDNLDGPGIAMTIPHFDSLPDPWDYTIVFSGEVLEFWRYCDAKGVMVHRTDPDATHLLCRERVSRRFRPPIPLRRVDDQIPRRKLPTWFYDQSNEE